MGNANVSWHLVRWIVVFVSIIESCDIHVSCTACSDKANEYFVPVVKFCTDDTESGNPVVIDGFYADSLNDITTCQCVVTYSRNEEVTFRYENAYEVSPIQNVNECESTVTFSQSNIRQNSKSCRIDGNMTINTADGELDMYLRRDKPTGNRSYCFKLFIDAGEPTLKVSCKAITITRNITSSTLSTTQQVSVMPTSENNMFTSTLKDKNGEVESTTDYTDEITKPSSSTEHDINQISTHSKDSVTDMIQQENNNMLYIGIGSGIGVILVIAIVICFVRISRKNTKQSKSYENTDNNQTANEDNDEYGLQYNSLYISSDRNNMHHSKNEHQATDLTNAVHNEIEGNYSEIDLVEHHNRFNDNRSSSETSPKAPTRKDNGCSFISEEGQMKHKASVKHVSFGDNGCEYAVVEKTKRS